MSKRHTTDDTTARQYLKDAVLNGQQGHIECAASQVKDEDIGLLALACWVHLGSVCVGGASALLCVCGATLPYLGVKAVCECRCRGLVDDTAHIQASNGTSMLGCSALGVAKVGRHRDDCLVDLEHSQQTAACTA